MPLTKKPFISEGPCVYVIGVQQILRNELREFLNDEGFPDWNTGMEHGGEAICEVAGRVCYMSFAGGREHGEYVANIKESKHGSVLEHATITFVLTGVSRALTHELVRHRAGWAYSQLSQRFVDESNAQMVAPRLLTRITSDTERRRLADYWKETVAAAHDAYGRLVKEFEWSLCPDHVPNLKHDTRLRKTIRGAARSVLPSATETKIVCTVNARALRHFFEMRASEEADDEIRDVAMKIYRAALRYWPDILADYEVKYSADGQPYLSTHLVKV